MDIFLTILIFLVMLGVLVFVHEFGHFITAKARKVKVEEFALGFPPRIFSFKRGETIYSLNAIPLGGFTKMAGEEDPKVERSLASKGPWTRILVLSAGSIMNLLLPILLFTIAFMVPHQVVTEPIVIGSVDVGSPAANVGLQAGDRIISIDGEPMGSVGEVQRTVYMKFGQTISIDILRNSVTTTVYLVPRWQHPSDQGAVGIHYDVDTILANRVISTQSEPFWQAIPDSFGELADTFVIFKNGIISMIIGTEPVSVTGPVGVAQLTGEVAKSGLRPLLEFAAFLSINLGIVNLLPLPALDGGRIIFVLLEMIRRGKRIAARTEGMIHFIGFALLILLMIIITYQDIFRIATGG
jgi:regulator of sigma E protease